MDNLFRLRNGNDLLVKKLFKASKTSVKIGHKITQIRRKKLKRKNGRPIFEVSVEKIQKQGITIKKEKHSYEYVVIASPLELTGLRFTPSDAWNFNEENGNCAMDLRSELPRFPLENTQFYQNYKDIHVTLIANSRFRSHYFNDLSQDIMDSIDELMHGNPRHLALFEHAERLKSLRIPLFFL